MVTVMTGAKATSNLGKARAHEARPFPFSVGECPTPDFVCHYGVGTFAHEDHLGYG
jgi:hypothetical protein